VLGSHVVASAEWGGREPGLGGGEQHGAERLPGPQPVLRPVLAGREHEELSAVVGKAVAQRRAGAVVVGRRMTARNVQFCDVTAGPEFAFGRPGESGAERL